MAQNDRLQIFPSRANSVLMTQRMIAAKRGKGLLLRKRDAIELKLREIRSSMAEKSDQVDASIRAAIFAVTKANLLGTDFKPSIITDSRVGSTFLRKRQQKVVGVTLNFFELEMDEQGVVFPMAGLSCGGQQVGKVRRYFQQALEDIVAYASLEYMLRMLGEASHQTNMRVSALDYVILPQLTATSNYINTELEEFEREDFYRLKRSQAKQLETKLAFSELIKTKNMTQEELENYIKKGGHRLPQNHEFNFQDFEEKQKPTLREAYLQRHSIQGKGLKPPIPTSVPDPSTAVFLQRRVKRDPHSSSASFIAVRSPKFMYSSEPNSIEENNESQ